MLIKKVKLLENKIRTLVSLLSCLFFFCLFSTGLTVQAKVQCKEFLAEKKVLTPDELLIQKAILTSGTSPLGVSINFDRLSENMGLRPRDLLMMERPEALNPPLSSEGFYQAISNIVLTDPDVMIGDVRLHYVVTVKYDVPLANGRAHEVLYVWLRDVGGKKVVHFLETSVQVPI